MRTQGEIEAAICERISRFEQDYMGRNPKQAVAIGLSKARKKGGHVPAKKS
jgi:uncharacterized protein YbcI